MNRKILVVDDSESIHEDFRKILCRRQKNAFNDLDSFIFGESEKQNDLNMKFELESAYQGQDANRMVIQSITDNSPFAMAFVDMRMPPGWGGIETVKHLWQSDPNLEIVICSAYSDYSWKDIISQLGGTDKLLFLKKPFDNIEIRQLAFSLTEKWNLKQQASLKLIDLESLVKQRTEQLQRSSEARLEFFTNMSHEIRTPISGILGMLELLSNSDLNKGQKTAIDLAKLSATSLFALINDVLDYSKIQSNNLCLESINFSLSKILEEVAQMYSVLGHQKRLSLYCKQDLNIPDSLVGDPTRIKQILINLVGNALKFTSDGYIYIKSRVLENNSKSVKFRIEVADTGIGIEKEKTKDIFGKFQQGSDSISRSYGGTGLGLSISQELVELMNGHIGVESELGMGSTFYMDLELLYNDSKKQSYDSIYEDIILFIEDSMQLDIFTSYLDQFGLSYNILMDQETFLSSNKSGIFFSDNFDLCKEKSKSHNVILLIDISNPMLLDPQFLDIQILTLPLDHSELIGVLKRGGFDDKASVDPYAVSSKVLVVEDSPVNQKYICFVLNKLSCTVDLAITGEEAIEKLKSSNDYDLIFMDCNLPNMNGYETVSMIRKEKLVAKDVAIIAMTANETEQDKMYSAKSGMNDFVTKPFDMARVQFILNKYTNKDCKIKKSGKFLIIDSDMSAIKSKVKQIQVSFEHATIDFALNGLEGCSHIRKSTPDYLILDLDLDLVSGIEIITLLASKEEFESVKVIVSTDYLEDYFLFEQAKKLRPIIYHNKSTSFETVANLL
ncbi:MAG: response regulator [Candidatus Cloacimonetes bacterium]|nr:response regulator [Candidatus Cloacimonadota bacterium]